MKEEEAWAWDREKWPTGIGRGGARSILLPAFRAVWFPRVRVARRGAGIRRQVDADRMPDGRTGMEKTCACHPAALDPWSIGKSKAGPRWWLPAPTATTYLLELW